MVGAAAMAELADALVSGTSELYARGGSNPLRGTKPYPISDRLV